MISGMPFLSHLRKRMTQKSEKASRFRSFSDEQLFHSKLSRVFSLLQIITTVAATANLREDMYPFPGSRGVFDEDMSAVYPFNDILGDIPDDYLDRDSSWLMRVVGSTTRLRRAALAQLDCRNCRKFRLCCNFWAQVSS